MSIDDKSREVCRKLHLPEDGKAFVAIRLALKEQDRDTRHACAEAVNNFSYEVEKANTYRGRVNRMAEHACDQLVRAHGIIINTRAE